MVDFTEEALERVVERVLARMAKERAAGDTKDKPSVGDGKTENRSSNGNGNNINGNGNNIGTGNGNDNGNGNGSGGSKKKQKKQATIECDNGGAFTVVPVRRKPATKTSARKPDGQPTTPATDTTAAAPTPSTTTTVPDHKMIGLRPADWPVKVCENARQARDLGGVAFVPAAKYSEAVMVSDKARPFLVVTAYQPKTDLPVTRRTVPVVQGGKTICKTMFVTQVGKHTEESGEKVVLSGPPKSKSCFQNGTEVLRVAVWKAHSGATWEAMRESEAKARETLHKWICKYVGEIPKEWVFGVQLVGAGAIDGKVRVRRTAVAKTLAESGQEGVFTASWDRKEPVVWLKDGTYGEAMEMAKTRGVVLGLAAKAKAIGFRVGTEEERANLQQALGEEAVTKDTRERFVVRGLPYGISHEQVEEMLIDMQWPAQIINVRANNALVAAWEEPPSRIFDLDGSTVRVDDFTSRPKTVMRAKEWSYLAVASGAQQQATPAQTAAVAKDQQTEMNALREENKLLKEQLKRMEAQLAAISATLAQLKGSEAAKGTEEAEEDVAMGDDACEHLWGKLSYPHAWECQGCGTDKSKNTVQYVCEGCKLAVCQDCKKDTGASW